MIQRVQENKQFQIIIIVKGKVQKKKYKETMGRQKKIWDENPGCTMERWNNGII